MKREEKEVIIGQIAELLGLTIETVSRQLTKLKAAGIIALPSLRAVTIRNRAALEARADATALLQNFFRTRRS